MPTFATLKDGINILRVLTSAPHRLLFACGAIAVVLTMLWWSLWLANARFALGVMPPTPVELPAGWAHAMLAQYGMLPLFMCGFLLTVFPRWLDLRPLSKWHYVPVAAGILGGYILVHGGLMGVPWLIKFGFGLMTAGYLTVLFALASMIAAARSFDPWALSCASAIALGTLGLMSFLAYLLGASWWWAFFAIKLGTFGLLLPIFFTVCHRMIPFFSGNFAARYRIVRPLWSLALVWTLLLAHLMLELAHAFAWTWPIDLSLTVIFAWHAFVWQPWKCMRPGLLAALHLAFAWLPIAFTMYAAQGLIYAISAQFVLGRAPLHALTIGFFGSMLVAMVTRVTQGHSGRPLQMGAVAWTCFVMLQGVVLVRIVAEVATDTGFWLVVAAFGWLLAFLPWIAGSLGIYATPRADGKPG